MSVPAQRKRDQMLLDAQKLFHHAKYAHENTQGKPSFAVLAESRYWGERKTSSRERAHLLNNGEYARHQAPTPAHR